jgi:hypothetical protein
MNKTLALIPMLALFTFSAYAKVVFTKDRLYLQKKGEQLPLSFVNEMIENKAISKIKLYGGGDVRMISFAKEDDKEKIYSVDEKGYVYSIEPFTSYSVSKVNSNGTVEFKQQPGRKYRISKEGFFLY